MAIQLFDIQCGFGGWAKGKRTSVGAEECLEELERLDIGGALVRTAPDELDRDVPASNEILFEACGGREKLVPCPVALPSGADDLPPETEQVRGFVARGAGAACVRPKSDGWLPDDWVSGALFGALEEARLPAFLLEREVPLSEVGRIARAYPELPIVVAEVSYRAQRTLVALLKSFPNVSLSTGSNLTVHRCIEHMVAEIGADRLLFGTGFPEAEPAMALTMLAYADVSDEEKLLIGFKNAERLFGEIRR